MRHNAGKRAASGAITVAGRDAAEPAQRAERWSSSRELTAEARRALRRREEEGSWSCKKRRESWKGKGE